MSQQIIIKQTSTPRDKNFVNWVTMNDEARKKMAKRKGVKR